MSTSLGTTTNSELVFTKRSKPENAQPSVEERRHRLLESTKEAFPDGKIPNLFTTVLLMRSSNDANDDNLPFIRVESIVVTSPTGDDSHQTIFNDVWCLWDTGAQVSYVVSDLLDPYVRDNESAGCATMEIKCVLFAIWGCLLMVTSGSGT